MAVKVGINGFGRIGRNVFRAARASNADIEFVAVKAAWENGVKSGGVSVADPGEQRSHGSGSYSAFLKDPDGYEIEITIGSD